MEQSRNIDFNSEVEMNSMKDALWRLTTRVYLLEDFISEHFGQVLGPAGFSEESSMVPSSPKLNPLHSPTHKRKTMTSNEIGSSPSTNISSRTRSGSKRKTKDVDVSAKAKCGVNIIAKNANKRKTCERESMERVKSANIDVDSYDIDHSESTENGIIVLVPRRQPGDRITSTDAQLQTNSLEENKEDCIFQEDNDVEPYADSDSDSQDANQSEINENDFIVFVPKEENWQGEGKTTDTSEGKDGRPDSEAKIDPDFVSQYDIGDRSKPKKTQKHKEGESSAASHHSVAEFNDSAGRINRRGYSVEWTLTESFDNEKCAKEKLVLDNWELRVDFTRPFPGGKKVFYKCLNRCPAKAYLLILDDQSEVSLYTNGRAHSEHEQSRGISKRIKLRIEQLDEEGLKQPEIMKVLEEEKLPLPDSKKLKRCLDYCRTKKYGKKQTMLDENTVHIGQDIKLQMCGSNLDDQVHFQVVEEVEISQDHIVVYK